MVMVVVFVLAGSSKDGGYSGSESSDLRRRGEGVPMVGGGGSARSGVSCDGSSGSGGNRWQQCW